MKLTDLHETVGAKPVLAWLEPASGPEDIRGVRLAYIQPLAAHYDDLIKKAQEEADKGNSREQARADRLRKDKERYTQKGQRFFTPDMGWWMNERDFYEDREGFGGVHKGQLQVKYPNLKVVSSREEAIKMAEQAGLI